MKGFSSKYLICQLIRVFFDSLDSVPACNQIMIMIIKEMMMMKMMILLVLLKLIMMMVAINLCERVRNQMPCIQLINYLQRNLNI